MEDILSKFRADLEIFLREAGISRTRFGYEAMNDPHIISRWLDGKGNPRASSMQKVYDYMTSQRQKKQNQTVSVNEGTPL